MLWYLLQPSHIKDATLLEKKSRNLKEQLTVKKNESNKPILLTMKSHQLYVSFLSYVIHDQTFPLPDQFSVHLTTRIDKVISYFKFKKHNHLTQEYPQLTYNVATNSKNDQRQIKTTTPQPTLNLRHFPKALFFHYFLIKLNLGYLSSLLSL